MRILRLCFENLNSLRGRSEVDFTTGPLASAGLFAITGPTGAGKSTFLDAITLALYGRAARYGGTPNPDTMMSRQTGDCLAELDFVCSAGHFRCSWALQRARKRPDGRVQSPKRRLIALPSGEVLAEKVDDLARRVVELTGLDYERFLRSVMLAQGDFASFLRAKVDERASLLEQVTGTSLYRELSTASYQKAAEARAELERLSGLGGSIPVLADEARAAAEEGLRSAEGRAADLAQALRALQARLGAVCKLAALRQTQAELESAQEVLRREALDFAPQADRLRLAERAAHLGAPLQELDRLELRLGQLAARSAELERLLPSLSADFDAALEASSAAAATLARGREEAGHLQALCLRVQAVDTRLAELRAARERLARARAESQAEVSAQAAALAAEEKAQAALAEVVAKGTAWLEANAADAQLAERLPALADAARHWEEASSLEQQCSAKLAARRAELALAAARINAARGHLQKAGQSATAPAAALEHLRGQVSEALASGDEAALSARREKASASHAALLRLAELAQQLESTQARLDAQENAATRAAASLEALELSLAQISRERVFAQELLRVSRSAHAYALRCAELSQHRPLLEEGRPCPLCGSTHHPAAAGVGQPEGELARARRDEEAAQVAHDELVARQQHAQSEAERLRRLCEDSRSSAQEYRVHAEQLQGKIVELALPPPGPDAPADLGERLRAAEQEEQAALQGLRRLAELRQSLHSAELRHAEARAACEKASADLASQQALQAQLLRQEQELSAEASAARERLQAAGASARSLAGEIQPGWAGDAPALRLLADDCSRRARVHAKALDKVQAAGGDLRLRESARAQAARDLAGRQEGLGRLEAELAASEAALRQLEDERQALFGTREIAAALEDERRRIQSLETAEASAAARRQRAHEARQASLEESRRVAAEREQARGALQELGGALQARLSELGLADLAALRAALPAPGELSALREAVLGLERRGAALAARRHDLGQELNTLPSGALEDLGRRAELEASLADLESRLAECNQALGSARRGLELDDENRARLGLLLGQSAAARRELARWDELRALIGSADGSLFARFAQGLTLDRLAWLANVHLGRLNPRYSLRRQRGPEARDLELEIVDHYQAGSLRPMGSLSGGESFLASLALALALSELASGRNAIESLFIDEGFGSLDGDTLESAMAALESLQASGKTIGVISHVQAMQERIPVQIRIVKEAGGCSRVLLPA